ncbi:hypothetical protein ACQJBY_072884 [Aegilops geniculata]
MQPVEDMDQIVVNRARIDHQTHLHLRTSVVPILIYYNRQSISGKPKDLSQPAGLFPGIVTVSAGNFCHIIAAARSLFPRIPDLFRFEILFPNGTTVDTRNIVVERGETLAAFFVFGSIGDVNEVRFVDQPVSRNHSIKMFGYYLSPFPPRLPISELCDGFASHPGDRFFRHDCTPSHISARGSAVFNDQERLVGISYERHGLTNALDVEGIRYELLQIYGGMNEMSILQIVEHIRALGEVRAANLAGPS